LEWGFDNDLQSYIAFCICETWKPPEVSEIAGETDDEMDDEIAGETDDEMDDEIAGETDDEMDHEIAGEMAGEVDEIAEIPFMAEMAFTNPILPRVQRSIRVRNGGMSRHRSPVVPSD
jgi:hypothetical protein